MLFRNVGARSGAWFKKALFVAAAKRQFNFSIPQKACSALLRGFESRNRDWEPKNRIFVYNAFALRNTAGRVVFF